MVDGLRVEHRRVVPTPHPATPAAVTAAIEELVAWACERVGREQLRGVPLGVASAGVVRDGLVTAMNRETLPGWEDFSLADELRPRLDRPVFVVNDAHAAAWGEYLNLGPGNSLGFGFVTVSTGVGFGFVLGGRLVTGARGLAGHLGFTRVATAEGIRYLEEAASGRALDEAAHGLGLSSPAALVAAAESWTGARSSLAAAVCHVRRALGDAAVLLDLDTIVVGGSVGLNPRFFAALASERLHPLVDVELRPAALGPDAGLVGAAALAAGIDP